MSGRSADPDEVFGAVDPDEVFGAVGDAAKDGAGEDGGWDTMPTPEPFRDEQVHVMAEKCSTCVFHPGNRMHLPPGRLKEMTEHVQSTGVPFSCHQTLPYAADRYQEHYGGAALCHGAVEKYGPDSNMMRMAHLIDQERRAAGQEPFVIEHQPYDGPDPEGVAE